MKDGGSEMTENKNYIPVALLSIIARIRAPRFTLDANDTSPAVGR